MKTLATPTAAAFLAHLPRDPATALAEIDGALLGDKADPRWSPDERSEVVAERLRLMRRAK